MSEAETKLGRHRNAWDSKGSLRGIYWDYHRRVLAACKPGLILEIGGGLGCLKSTRKDVVCTDIQMVPWLDVVADAQRLPIGDASIDNIVMIDVLHHIERPRHFFDEARRTLKAGGHLVMLEPAVTPGSWPIYRYFHHEPVDMSADPLVDGEPSTSRDPYLANQAVPTLLFRGRPSRFETTFPDLEVVERSWLSLLAYPLSGGYQAWSLMPAWMVRPLLRLEGVLAPTLGRLLGFRLFIVVRKG